jgi:tetratricopeptide (TPR) repeat protein
MHGDGQGDARREFETALEIDPNYVPALYWGSIQLVGHGRFEDALECANRARRLDPLSVTVEIVYANIYFFWGRWAEALRHYRSATELEPRMPWTHMRMVLCLAAMGQLEEALQRVDELDPSLRESLELVSARANILGRLGRIGEARALILKLDERSKGEYVAWTHFAYALAGVDDREALLEVLSDASQKNNIGRLMLKLDPAFEAIRQDPRFQSVLPADVTSGRRN